MYLTKMKSPYLIRNYHSSDLEDLISLVKETGALESKSHLSPQNLVESMVRRQNYFPERDLFIADVAGRILGYVNVIPELNIDRVVLCCLVHPRHRRRGLGVKLFERATNHGKQLGAKVAHTNIFQNDVVSKRFLTKLGFRFVRLYRVLKLDLSDIPYENTNQHIACRHLNLGEEGIITNLQNRSFADTWGYNPNTVEEVSYRTSLPSYSLRNIIVAYERKRPVGYCWVQVNPEKQGCLSRKRGRIYMLGVDPDYRGRGIGRTVLLAGLQYLKSKNCQFVELTVDYENKAATSLYRSIGFNVWTASLWYEKTLY